MKYVKMLGLAAVAAAALMAFVGSSTASATVLCKTAGEGATTGQFCQAGWAYPKETAIHAVFEATEKLPKATLTTEFMNIECSESTVSGKTENEGGATETVKGKVETLTFGGCNCEVKVLKPGSLEVHWIPDTRNGTLTSTGAEVTATCNVFLLGKVHCIYSTNATDLGTATGGVEATMDIESADIPRLTTDGLCDKTANWDAHYKVTSPTPLYVSNET